MSIDIKESIRNILRSYTQETADEWAESHREEKKPLDEFIATFGDYTKEGLSSLIAVLSISLEKEKPASLDIEKNYADKDKFELYYNLVRRRLLATGYKDDETLDDKITSEMGINGDIDKLLAAEIKKVI